MAVESGGTARMDADVRVFIVDDHVLVRRGLRDMVSIEKGIVVVGEAATREEALRLIPNSGCDVVVLDNRLPDGEGIEICASLAEKHPKIRCVILTGYVDDETIYQAAKAGALGVIAKEASTAELAEAIRSASKGLSFFDPRRLAEAVHRIEKWERAREPLSSLTPQEHRLLTLIADGKSDRDIAETLSLANTIERIEEDRRKRQQFLANLAHELRSPLTPILAWAQLLLRREDTPDHVREFCEMTERRGSDLLGILDSLMLLLSAAPIAAAGSDAYCPVRQALEQAAAQGVAAGLHPTIDVSDDAAFVGLDPFIFQGALQRIVDNAIKFGSVGGPLELRAKRNGARVDISVGNDGLSIPQEDRKRIFESFAQGDGSATRAHGGLGLGLYVARSSVVAKGGDITVEDREGGGVRFVLNLPAVEPQAGA